MTDETVTMREEYGGIWRTDDFPLTPLEAWYVMRGFAVRPKAGITVDQVLEMPGQIELSDGYVMLRQT
jgi:hypothetical protein